MSKLGLCRKLFQNFKEFCQSMEKGLEEKTEVIRSQTNPHTQYKEQSGTKCKTGELLNLLTETLDSFCC